jgi:predicted  nucleic acid-binding Zn-ribbon protein
MTNDETIADLLDRLDEATQAIHVANESLAEYAQLVASYKQTLDKVLDDKEAELREMEKKILELHERPIMKAGEFK